MANTAVFTAALASVVLDARRDAIDPRKLKFHRSRREPTGDELKALNERRIALAQSWLDKPIHEIFVRDGDFAIADGNERVSGLLLLGIEKVTICLLPANTSDAELDSFSVLTDVHKTKLRPFELASVIHRYIKATAVKKGEAASTFRIDQGYLTKLVSLFDCDPKVIEAAEANLIGPSDWYIISQSGSGQLETLRLKLGGATRDQLAASVRRKPVDAQKVPALKMAMPQGRGIVIRGGVNLETAREMLETGLKQVNKAISDGLTAKSAAVYWKDSSKKDKPARKKRVKADTGG